MSVMFKPHEKRSMKGDYPELADIPEFSDLSDKEMRLAWWFACASSPLSSVPTRRERMKQSLQKVYGSRPPEQLQNELLTGNYSERHRAAFERMGRFSLDVRTAANAMTMKIFKNYEKIIDIAPEEIAEMEDDEKANYVKLSSSITKDLPGLVHQLESGYGLKERGVEEGGGNIMDMLISEG